MDAGALVTEGRSPTGVASALRDAIAVWTDPGAATRRFALTPPVAADMASLLGLVAAAAALAGFSTGLTGTAVTLAATGEVGGPFYLSLRAVAVSAAFVVFAFWPLRSLGARLAPRFGGRANPARAFAVFRALVASLVIANLAFAALGWIALAVRPAFGAPAHGVLLAVYLAACLIGATLVLREGFAVRNVVAASALAALLLTILSGLALIALAPLILFERGSSL